MAIPIIVPVAASLGLLLFAFGGKKASAAPAGTPIIPATPGGGEPVIAIQNVTGKSGKPWKVVQVGSAVYDVYSPAGTWGPHGELRVLRYKLYAMPGESSASKVLSAAVEGVPPQIMAAAMSDLGIRTPPVTVMTPPGRPPMPMALQQEMTEVMMQLGVDSAGNVRGPVTAEAVRHATELSSRLEQAGYPEAAALIRQYATTASKMIPRPAPSQQAPAIPGVPPDVMAQISRALELERDPAKLEILRNALTALPPSAERNMAIGALDALILQIRTQQAVTSAAVDIDQMIKSPGLPQHPALSQPIPRAVTQPSGAPRMLKLTSPMMKGEDVKVWQGVLAGSGYPMKVDGIYGPGTMAATKDWQTKHGLKADGIVGPQTRAKIGSPPTAPTSVPARPQPARPPAAKSTREIAGDAMVTHLLALQKKYGVKGSKGKQDVTLVKRFQKEVGGVADGLPGVNTMLSAAQAGIGTLPKVMYWGKTATRNRDLPTYKTNLGAIAQKAQSLGLATLAAQILQSAAAEDGSGGLS